MSEYAVKIWLESSFKKERAEWDVGRSGMAQANG